MKKRQFKRHVVLLAITLAALIMLAGARPPASGETGAAAASPFNNPASYTVTDLGPITPYAINNNGQVAGHGPGGALLWDAGASIYLGASIAYDLNDAGQVVGKYIHPNGNNEAFIWQDLNGNGQADPGEMQLLGSLGGPESVAYGINNLGHVAGTSYISQNDRRAFRWPGGGVLLNLGTLGGDQSEAHAINDAGQIAGESRLASGSWRAFRWANGQMQNLGATADDSGAHAINNLGQVTGFDGSAQFLWLPEAAYGLPAGRNNLGFPGGSQHSYAINDLGQVIGGGAYLWQNGVTTNINNLFPPGSGWYAYHASDINDRGQIVGLGVKNGQHRGFILTPVKWTLLFYWAGDNNLDAGYVPIFNQLEAAANNPHVNLVVAWDRWNAPSHYYHVQHDTDLNNLASYVEGETIWSKGELDMSNPATLSEFVLWAVENFPAEYYALLPSNHGTGLGGGLCEGWTCEKGIMTLAQMQTALSDIFWEMERPLDVLYMDMCLMGMIEDAYQFRGLADYYVASEHLQWDFREPYFQYVAGITVESTPAEVAVMFADSYAAAGAASLAAGHNTPYTISAADMNRLDDLVAAANSLATALNSQMDVISGTLTSVAMAVQRYDNQRPKGIDLQDTYVDLYDFADLVTQMLSGHPEIVAAAEEVKTAVNQYVIANHRGSSASVNVDNSHGVSIFFPAMASSFYNPANYDFAVGANWGGPAAAVQAANEDVTWGALLVNYFHTTQPGGPDDPDMPWPQPRSSDSESLYLPLIVR